MFNKEYIWFDLGYTLVSSNREEIYRELLLEGDIEKFLDEIGIAFHITDKYYMRFRQGALSNKTNSFYSEYFKLLNQNLKIEENNIDPIKIKKVFSQYKWSAFPHTLSTLETLKEDGYKVGLISNWNNTARSVLNETGIIKYLDEVVISSEIQIEKPDERIFKYALEKAGVTPECCIYIGDNYYDDVVGSKKISMESILINQYGKLGIEEIKDIMVIKNIKDITEIFKKGKEEKVGS